MWTYVSYLESNNVVCLSCSEEADLYGATVTSDDETAIAISWYEPFLDEPVVGYGVDVFEIMSSTETLVQSHTTTETNIHLMDLDPGTDYSIEIEAIVESGSRVPSTVIGVSTPGGKTANIYSADGYH